jgi:ribose transport system substrate-binding protein
MQARTAGLQMKRGDARRSSVRRGAFAAAWVIAATLLASACGSSDDNGSSPGSGSDGSDGASAPIIDKLVKGTFTQPGGDPLPIEPGKDIWVISCGQVTVSCATQVRAVENAAKEVDWTVHVFDGKADPAEFVQGVRQAISAKADGIVLTSVDCALVQAPAREALARGIKIAALAAIDCDDPNGGGGEPLFHGRQPVYPGYDSFGEALHAWSKDRAKYLIEANDGKGTYIDVYNAEFPYYKVVDAGFVEGMKACSDCKVERVGFQYSEFGSGLQQKLEQALLKNPDATAVVAPDDGTVTGGVSAAVQASGRSGDIFVFGGEGFTQSIELIANDGGQDASLAWGGDWLGWATIDTLNSEFHGKQPRESGLGWQLVTAKDNLPADGKTYEPPVDYRAVYRELWGID